MKKCLIILLVLMLTLSLAMAEALPSENDALHVEGTQLVDGSGSAVVLRGLSTHGIAWFPQYVSGECFAELKQGFGINLIRLAMYTAENGGYCTDGDREAIMALVRSGVEAAVENDMYVIVDWHILSDSNPLQYANEAVEFFDVMSAEFGSCPNVIYEICNEPNSGTTWQDIRTYALQVIPVIRANAPDAVIIVGTPDWSQRVDLAAKDPITEYDNIMYALHFYSATHKQGLRDAMTDALSAGLPVFVTEFGICSADGNGEYDVPQANAWMDTMDEYGISCAMWNISNKDELSAIFRADCDKTAAFTADDLNVSGLWLAHRLGGSLETPFDGMDERPEAVADATNMCGDNSGWGSWIDKGAGADATVTQENGVVTADVVVSGDSKWFVQPQYTGLKLEQGAKYELIFTMSATADITADIQVQQNYSPYGAYMALQDQTVTAQPQVYSAQFEMTAETDGNVSLVFNVGANEGAPYVVTICDVSLRRIG